jgi:cellulose synthase/poly-beta-1,6-N-acetylglucosamine synthase-like glycosyltransferase
MAASDMMLSGLIAGYSVLAISTAFPVVLLSRFIWQYHRKLDFTGAPERLPKVAVILSLRGADPHLRDCLIGLLTQNYPRYSVYIIVDSAEDPAMAVVEEVLQREHSSNVDVQVALLEQRGEQCSLKMSAQLQVLTKLGDDFEVVAFVDGDSITTRNWLRYMVTPFANCRVGATSGFRWFVPADRPFGSLVRQLYNIGGDCVFRTVFHIPWGGSLALRHSVLRESNLLSYWRKCFCEDVSLYRVLRAMDLRLEFVPAATNFNSEPIELRGTYRFIHRQIMCVRLHSVFWPVICTSGLAHNLALWIGLILLAVGLATQSRELILGIGSALAVYAFVGFSALKVSDRLVRQRENPPPHIRYGWKLIPAFVLLLAMSTYSMIASLFVRTVEWRGIRYRIEGRDRLYLLEYSAYVPPGQNVSGPLSIS